MILLNPDINPWVLIHPLQTFTSLLMLVCLVAAMGVILKVGNKEEGPQ